MKHEYPENFARFYDLLYEELRDSVDKNFFMNHIQKCKGKVLEVGVGTGRFFSPNYSRIILTLLKNLAFCFNKVCKKLVLLMRG